MLTYNSTARFAVHQLPLEFVRFFPRQMLTADDMRAEQQYIRERFRRHNRYLHGWGVVCGCEVVAAATMEHPWQVKICAGYVVTPRGDEVLIPNGLLFDLAEDRPPSYDPCADMVPCPPMSRSAPQSGPKTVYLAVCYAECDVRPVRMHPAGCGCDDASCEYSRTREGFELVQLSEWPDSHQQADQEDEALCQEFQIWKASDSPTVSSDPNAPSPAMFVPRCREISEDDCVVLAQITLPENKTSQIGGTVDGGKISYDGRRVLYSTQTLQIVCDCKLEATPGSVVAISIHPENVELITGGTQQFTATVTGSVNTAVIWSVQEATTGGSITASGMYTAPQILGTYHVIATSQADPTKSATATIQVVANPISVSINPTTVYFILPDPQPGSQQFTAIVTGSNNTAVTWKIEEGQEGGSITTEGLYKPPAPTSSTGGHWTYHVVATSQADPTKSATATVDVSLIT